MKRTDKFVHAFDEWTSGMGFTGNKAGDATRVRGAVLYYLLSTKEDALLGDALELGIKVYGLRNVGKIGYRMYNEFVKWAEGRLRLDEKTNSIGEIWEQRKFDVAKEVFAALVQRETVGSSMELASLAIEFAKDFIYKYKKEGL